MGFFDVNPFSPRALHFLKKNQKFRTDALRQREDQRSTGIGSGIAIPHAFSPAIDEVKAVFGRSREGIDFCALDSAPVHYVVLFLVPEEKYTLHIVKICKVIVHCEIV